MILHGSRPEGPARDPRPAPTLTRPRRVVLAVVNTAARFVVVATNSMNSWVDAGLGTRCPLCRDRHRQMDAHLGVDHFGEGQ